MSSSTSMKSVLVTASILSLASQALGHMEMSWPYALHSKYNPANSYNVIDYSMTSPLVADGSNFPCKGYQNDRPFTPVVTYAAGTTYNMTLAGSAVHGGGSCQLSLSYDNGATFRVIKSMMGGCPLTSTYDFTIPSYAPDGNALFAWTWQNEQGNREFYMNCAQVAITGGDDSSSFNSLPFIWKANLAGINDCATPAGVDPVYPHPGPDVQYGGSITSSSTPNPGTCDAPTPFGQTYKDLGDTPKPNTGSSGGGSAPTTVKTSSPSSSAYNAPSSSVPTTLQSTTRNSVASSAAASSAGVSSVTLSTAKAGVTHQTTANAPAPTSTGSDDDGDDGEDDGDDTCGPDVTVTVYSSSTSSAAASAAPTSGNTAPPTDPDSEYATGDLQSYLPCVPGTYICTSSSTWVTCDSAMYSDGSTSWVYRGSRSLGNGAVCVPSFSPYASSTTQYAQQADSPAGYYRDDRIAYSTGNKCAENGDIMCTSSGGFQMCADTVWMQMGSTAPGTSCVNGDLVVSS